MEKGGGREKSSYGHFHGRLDVTMQVDKMFVDGVGLEFTLPPEIDFLRNRIFSWGFTPSNC
jgi:hypothetical protein